MMRSVLGKAVLVALVAAGGASLVGCSGNVESGAEGRDTSGGKPGELGLTLRPISGINLSTVSYSITFSQSGPVVRSGSVPVPGTGKDFSFGVPLPVGTGYYLSLSAATADGQVICGGGFGPFNITANTALEITPTLTCTDVSLGSTGAVIDIETDACPDITFDSVVVTPTFANVGSALQLLSNATSSSGNILTYGWAVSLPSLGSFTPANAKNTSFVCSSSGTAIATVSADNGECAKSIEAEVTCVNAEECGNGVVDPGETCDVALDPICPADCVQICGDGVVEGSEQCEPPSTAACSATCTMRGSCGDGFVTGAEQCDPSASPTGAPPGTTCTSSCLVESIIFDCGDGIVNGTDTCDAPGGNNYTVDDCGDVWGSGAIDGSANDCNPITPAACASCEASSECAELMDPGILSGSAVEGPASGTPRRELYFKTLDCVRDTGCAVGNVLDCYCGTMSSAQCDAGNGNGACRAIIEQGLETTNPTEVSNRLSNVTLGGGLALARIACDKNNCVSACGL
jgi:hypothetical protein